MRKFACVLYVGMRLRANIAASDVVTPVFECDGLKCLVEFASACFRI